MSIELRKDETVERTLHSGEPYAQRADRIQYYPSCNHLLCDPIHRPRPNTITKRETLKFLPPITAMVMPAASPAIINEAPCHRQKLRLIFIRGDSILYTEVEFHSRILRLVRFERSCEHNFPEWRHKQSLRVSGRSQHSAKYRYIRCCRCVVVPRLR